MRLTAHDLKKPLKVKFIDEEGIDAGACAVGVRRRA